MWLTLALVLAAALVVVRRRYLYVTVVGHSMMPTLRDGERVLARRARRVRRGDIVAFVPPAGHSYFPELVHRVKRAVAIAGDTMPPAVAAALGIPAGGRVPSGKLVVLGDNPHSEDSRHYGFVDEATVIAVISRAPGGELSHR